VIDQFAARMRAENLIESEAIDRFEKLLRRPAVPKPEEINAALFYPSFKGKV
jgi:hypothetical protein